MNTCLTSFSALQHNIIKCICSTIFFKKYIQILKEGNKKKLSHLCMHSKRMDPASMFSTNGYLVLVFIYKLKKTMFVHYFFQVIVYSIIKMSINYCIKTYSTVLLLAESSHKHDNKTVTILILYMGQD